MVDLASGIFVVYRYKLKISNGLFLLVDCILIKCKMSV